MENRLKEISSVNAIQLTEHLLYYCRVRLADVVGECVLSEMRCEKCGRPLIESSPINGVIYLCQGCNAEEAHCSCKPLSQEQ